jgi:2-polyprenyl-6-methoxyphenol hydroxylase-like FAD-dependent oxidoreductase
MTVRKEFHVVIVGGSLVGLSTVLALDKASMQITRVGAHVCWHS